VSRFRLRWAGALGLAFFPIPWNIFPLIVPPAHAGAPAAAPRTFSRAATIRLPLHIDEATRANLTEIKLFVKAPGMDWTLAQVGLPGQASFDYRAATDGDYAFMFVTVDKGGRSSPSNLNSRAPHQVLVVDSTPPELSVSPLPVANRDIYLQCRMKDANPDWASVVLEYPIGDNQWRQMEPANPDSPGVFRIPHASVLEGKVRAAAKDKAGNMTTRIFNMGDPTKTYDQINAPPMIPSPVSLPKDVVRIEQPPTQPIQMPAPIQQTAGKNENLEIKMPEFTQPPPVNGYNPTRLKPLENLAEKPDPVSIPDVPPAIVEPTANINIVPLAQLPPSTSAKVDPYLPAIDSMPPQMQIKNEPAMTVAKPATPPTPAPTGISHPILGTSRFTLDYAVENVVVGGQAKVEFWGTLDNGRTWQKVNDESNGRSPARLQMPGDGLYGIRVKANGNGAAPYPGEAPDAWVEVDTIMPTVKMTPPALGVGADAGTLTISWMVQDKNMSADSINIYHASRPAGPWLPIATGLRNDGSYRWLIPAGIGAEVYLRLEASDRAGNIGRLDLRDPVLMPQPKVRVLNIAPAR